MTKNKRLTPLHEAWPGVNVFLCGGSVWWGPIRDSCPVATGWIAVLATGAIYWAVVAPWLWQEGHVVAVWLALVMYSGLIISYAQACFTEPGVIPRRSVWRAIVARDAAFERRKAAVEEHCAGRRLFHPHSVEVQGDGRVGVVRHQDAKGGAEDYGEDYFPSSQSVPGPRNICKTCLVNRPPLSTHCRQCDNCVMEWDHHCNWIGNCVGQRNHRAFIVFLITVNWCMYQFAVNSVQYMIGVKLAADDAGDVLGLVATGLLVLLCLLLTCMLTGTMFMHLDFVGTGQTLKQSDREYKLRVRKHTRWYQFVYNITWFLLFYDRQPSLLPSLRTPLDFSLPSSSSSSGSIQGGAAPSSSGAPTASPSNLSLLV